MPKKGQLKGTPTRRAAFLDYLRTLGPGDECVFWPWSNERKKYVRAHINGQKALVHRWVYGQINGALPERPKPTEPGATGVVVRHTCDVRACCRPSHLVSGSQAQNIHDGFDRGRMHGRMNGVFGVRKLLPGDADRIRAAKARGVRQVDIARTFGISQAHVSQIIHGR